MTRAALLTTVCMLATAFAGCADDGTPPVSSSPPAGGSGCEQDGYKEPAFYVNLTTSHGNMVWEMRADKAPITTCNVLRYVNERFYDNTCFHRVLADFVVQGGGYDRAKCGQAEKPTHEPIRLETEGQLRNYETTLAMARTGPPDPKAPHTATSQFYINVANNSKGQRNDLDFDGRQDPGYAVFGKVVTGYDTAQKLEATGGGATTYIITATVDKSR